MLKFIAAATFLAVAVLAEVPINSYDSQHGVYIGKFNQLEFNFATGQLYAINDSAIQIVNFTFSENLPDTFFWLDSTEKPTRSSGIRLRTFEYGNSPIGTYSTANVILILPNNQKISNFKSFSIFSLRDNINYGTIPITESLTPPKSQILTEELQGPRYKISGVVQILDTRTIKVIAFSFEGDRAPDGYFFVGQGLNVTKDSGAKAAIRGRDSFDMILPMSERYTGGKDIFVELPDGYDIQHIDFLAIYSFRFDLVYASILLKNISRYSIPPFIPPQKRFEELLDSEKESAWNLSNLLGTASQRNFTFQLGPNGGKRGYQSMHRVGKPPNNVWYVNGYLANLYLKRGITYTFIVEGGRNISTSEFYNPLYLTNSSYGGFTKLTNLEKQYTKIYAPENITRAAGRLCRWVGAKRGGGVGGGVNGNGNGGGGFVEMDSSDADSFASFVDYRSTLRLKCNENGADLLTEPAVFTFTPNKETPSRIYFQSYNNYEMGSSIFVVDEFPADLKFIVEEPALQFDAWQNKANLELTRENSAAIKICGYLIIYFLILLPFVILI